MIDFVLCPCSFFLINQQWTSDEPAMNQQWTMRQFWRKCYLKTMKLERLNQNWVDSMIKWSFLSGKMILLNYQWTNDEPWWTSNEPAMNQRWTSDEPAMNQQWTSDEPGERNLFESRTFWCRFCFEAIEYDERMWPGFK